MTLNEATTLLASQLGKELDVPFKLMMAARIQVWRSRLIKNSIDKNPQERKFFRQVIYVPIKKESEVACCTTFPGCDIAVSSVKVPMPLRANNILFDYVGGVNGHNPFQPATGGFQVFMSQGKYSKGIIRYTWTSPILSVFGNPDLPMVRLEGIFDNPEEAAVLNCQTQATGCDFWNEPYPCSGDIMQLILQNIRAIDFNQPVVPTTAEIPVNAEAEKI